MPTSTMTIRELNNKQWTEEELQDLCNIAARALGYPRMSVRVEHYPHPDGRRADYCRYMRTIRMYPRSMQPSKVFLSGTIRTLAHEIAHEKSKRGHGAWWRKAHAKVFVWLLTHLGVEAQEIEECRQSALRTICFS